MPVTDKRVRHLRDGDVLESGHAVLGMRFVSRLREVYSVELMDEDGTVSRVAMNGADNVPVQSRAVSLDLDPMPRLLSAGYRESTPKRKPLCGRNVLSGSQGCWCEHYCNG